jgi:hypothetical protein
VAALAVLPRPTLYDLEETLQGLSECVETVSPEQEAEFLAEFGRALSAAVEKRDSVGRFLAHLESQIELAKAEIERLRERKASFEAALERLKTYVVRVIEAQGVKKLEGSTVTLGIRKCPASIEVFDEIAVPLDYKGATVRLPAKLLDRVLDALDFELAAQVLEQSRDTGIAVDKRAIKAALDAGTLVPGARFAAEKHSLVRK